MKRYSMEEIYPKSQMGKCMVYFNMSHHYRRIYSAKPRVDTNLTKKSQQFCCSSPDVYNFVRRNCLKQSVIDTPRHRVCAKEEDQKKPFKPKILDSRAESKLRKLPVYQPPQRIQIPKSSQAENKADTEKPQDNEDTEKEEHDKEEINNNEEREKEEKTVNIKEERVEKVQTESNSKEESTSSERTGYRPLSSSTVLFLKDITDDILRKGIYTNKSLEKLFAHHISKNKYSLPKDLMEQEVARLKMELDMSLEEEIIVKPAKSMSVSSLEDEEVLTALDSLLLPASIRDQVASSLGLKRKPPPPLPSPKDSFSGSLVLTSMTEEKGKNRREPNDPTGTYTKKSNSEKRNSLEKQDIKDIEGPKPSDTQTMDDTKEIHNIDDNTIEDSDYPEEASEHKSNMTEIKSEATEIKSEATEIQSEVTEIQSEGNSNATYSKSEEKSNKTEDKPNHKSDSGEKSSHKNNNENEGQSSDFSSIHTESD